MKRAKGNSGRVSQANDGKIRPAREAGFQRHVAEYVAPPRVHEQDGSGGSQKDREQPALPFRPAQAHQGQREDGVESLAPIPKQRAAPQFEFSVEIAQDVGQIASGAGDTHQPSGQPGRPHPRTLIPSHMLAIAVCVRSSARPPSAVMR